VEGTAIIAREFGAQLAQSGVSEPVIEKAKRLLDHISILEEARIAASQAGTGALHDVTEGGLATALEEFSIAGGYGIAVQVPRIPIFPETDRLCRAMGIDPLGLIGSGSLLISCTAGSSEILLRKLAASGIPAAHIGTVLDERPGIRAFDGEAEVEWPRFAVDEIARLFA
jgi:hydrogenase maturation factor